MIYDKLDTLIKEAMVSKDRELLQTLRSIKTEMVNATHAGTVLPDENNETSILKSMSRSRQKALDEFAKADRSDPNVIANTSQLAYEKEYIDGLLPKAPTPEETSAATIAAIESCLSGNPGAISNLQRHTKPIIDTVRLSLPTAEPSNIAKAIKEYKR